MCDAQCDGQHPCGDGYDCTADGYCMQTSGSGDPGGPDANCPAINFTPMPVTPSIGLVLDQSGSMFSNNISNGITRYKAMRDALVAQPNGVVFALQAKAYFGSELFTCNGNNNDFTTIPRALNNAMAIQGSLDSKTNGGNTPTPPAIDAEVAAFAATPPPAGSPPIIVLATDGLPNACNNGNADTRPQSVASVGAAFAAHIPVYVIAVNQDASSAQHFQDLANAGQGWQTGQPNIPYYPVASAQQLADAFQTIIGGVVSCDLTLTSSIDANAAMQGTVTLNGMDLMYGTDWTLVNGNIVRLTGSACTTLKMTATPMVSASFPCGSVIF
jgi:hypothetical protein